MSSINNLSVQQLRQAANLKEKIVALENQLAQLLGASTKVATNSAPKKKGGMSAAGRAAIVAAQKLRWAKIKAGNGKPSAPAAKVAAPAKKKSGMSAAGRAAVVAAQKARWAKIKDGKAPSPFAKVVAPAKKVAAPVKKKFVFSAAAKAKLSALAKARWAKIKAAKK